MRTTLDELWSPGPFSIFIADERPEFLKHFILPGAPKAGAVRLTMRGEIRLKRWRPFTAEEVIDHRRGFIWKARIGSALSGCDALVDGAAWSRWNMLGLVPVMRASGPDVRRSALGRWLIESCWLPTMMRPDDGAAWEGSTVTLSRFGESAKLSLGFDAAGHLTDLRMNRWGDPDGTGFGYHPFGAIVEEEKSFGGFVIPSRIRAGWHIGTPGWDEGEFFRASIQSAVFR